MVTKQNGWEESYHTVLEALPAAVMAIRNDTFVFVNEHGARMFGFSNPRQMIGISTLEMIAPESRELVKHRIERLEKGKDNPLAELEIIRKDGTRITIEASSVALPIEGKITAAVIAQDVTELKMTSLKLRESEERFRAFMDHYPANIYIKNRKLEHVYGNKTVLGHMGRLMDTFVGTRSRDFFPADVAETKEELDRAVLDKGAVQVHEHCRVMENGSSRWFRDIKFPIRFENGDAELGGISVDITDIKASEAKLKAALDEISSLKDRLERENIYLREEIAAYSRHDEIVGESSEIKMVLDQAEKVAGQPTCVLILGETGTGKELLARAIHQMSPRHSRQMITVNCAALPSNLIESELFGREKGAFTGALTKQMGRFEAADGSSIFLDEIGDLSVGLQAKLLRVLQDGQFERLGSPETIHVDVRVLTATNHDLKALVQEGRFRKDLYYRLNVFPIEIPPLRDRREDIPLLVWAFVKEFEERMGKTIRRVPQKSMDLLKSYSWPGNVRELRNVIERAMILSTGPYLDIPAFETEVDAGVEDLSLEEVQRKHIVNVLQKTGWRIRGEQGAAALLEVKPTTLEARIKKLGIQRN